MSASSKHILLAEDDPNFGIVLRDYLELHDYKECPLPLVAKTEAASFKGQCSKIISKRI